MKDIIKRKLRRLEEIIRKENDLCMIATHDSDGYHWNGLTYTDEKELSAAVRLTLGDYPEVPLLILSKHHTEAEPIRN